MRRALTIVALLALAGCTGLTEPPVSATCEKMGAKCKLGNGPLGVCVVASCRDSEKPPCYVCQPQH